MIQREKNGDIASFLLRTTLTVLAAGILVVQANGYSIDFEHLRVAQAGLIRMNVSPASARSFVDGRQIRLTRGEFASTYTPDVYDVEVQLNGYQSWHHLARVEPGNVVRFDHIILFPERIDPIGTSPTTTIGREAPLIDPRLRIINTELWYVANGKQQLVTRLSGQILAATLLGTSHVVYQTSDGIHAIDIDGVNDAILVAQVDPTPSPLILSSNDRVLAVVGPELTTQYQIQ